MNNTNRIVVITFLGVIIGFLGELLPDSIKEGIKNLFPMVINISFETAWITITSFVVILMIWLVRKSEKEINSNNKTHKKLKQMEKDKILELIDQDLDKALEELSKLFGKSNGTFNDLHEEYFSRPNNFSKSDYRGKLKAFVRTNL